MFARTASGSVRTSWPATIARPPVGLSTVLKIRRVVVLPAPLGPSSPKIAPGWHSKVTSATALDPAALIVEERLAEMLDLDHDRVPAGTETRPLTSLGSSAGHQHRDSLVDGRRSAAGSSSIYSIEYVPLPRDVAASRIARRISSSDR